MYELRAVVLEHESMKRGSGSVEDKACCGCFMAVKFKLLSAEMGALGFQF